MILDISVEGGQLLGLGPVAEPPLVCHMCLLLADMVISILSS